MTTASLTGIAADRVGLEPEPRHPCVLADGGRRGGRLVVLAEQAHHGRRRAKLASLTTTLIPEPGPLDLAEPQKSASLSPSAPRRLGAGHPAGPGGARAAPSRTAPLRVSRSCADDRTWALPQRRATRRRHHGGPGQAKGSAASFRSWLDPRCATAACANVARTNATAARARHFCASAASCPAQLPQPPVPGRMDGRPFRNLGSGTARQDARRL